MKPLQNLNKVSTHNEGNFFFFWGWMKNWNGKANFFLWSGRRNNHKAGSRRGTYACMYTDVQNLNNALNLKSISKTEAHQLSSEYAAVLLYTSCMQRILQRCCANPSERHTALQSQLCWIAWNSFPCCPLREETKTLPQPPPLKVCGGVNFKYLKTHLSEWGSGWGGCYKTPLPGPA